MKKLFVFLLLILLAAPACAAPDDPEAFAEWFIRQNFEGQEYYEWAAIFNALTDGIDRSREVRDPVKSPVYVAILSGTKYHTKESCSALKNASTVLKMDKAEAMERGFEKCGKCK